jgi:tetratricopeptide (TPR) repeat protein
MHKWAILLLILVYSEDGRGQSSWREWQAEGYYSEAKYEQALAIYRKLRAEEPNNAIWPYNLGTIYLKQEEYDSAAYFLTLAAEVNVDNAMADSISYNLANSHFNLGDMDKAIRHYTEVLINDPEHTRARDNLEIALARRQQQQHDSRQQNLEPSDFAREARRKALALASSRRYREAFELMQYAASQDSTVRAFAGFMQRLHTVATIAGD